MPGTEAVDLGVLLLRIVAGSTMAAHGYQKFFSGGRLAGTARWFDSMGMRPGRVHAAAAAGTEVGAGALLVLGLLTPFAGAAFVALMLVAAWTVHRRNGFFSVRSGYEYNLILAVVGMSIATTGPGRWSLDHLLGLDSVFAGYLGLAIAAVLGIAAAVGQLALFFRPPVVAAESG